MATAIDAETWSDEFKDAKCSICAQENRDEIADYYCFDCNKHMCKACLGTHNKFVVNHNTVEKGGDRTVVRPERKPSVEKSPDGKQIRKINLRIPEDKSTSDIYGCCHLSDGSLVIADYSNRRLKFVDPSSGKVTKHCDTDKQPTDVCSIGPQEVAVAVESSHVHVYNAVNLIRTRTINEGCIFKIACHGRLLYCATQYGNTLYVYDVSDGRKLREISLKHGMFCVLTGIAVTGDRLYITDMWTGLLCFITDGQQIFHLTEADLRLSEAQGVTTDHHGHVFVSGWKSKNVVEVTKDGQVVRDILSGEDEIERPRGLSYDVSRSQLCVGGESDQILMVKWE